MLDQLANSLQSVIEIFKQNFLFSLKLVSVFWIVHFINWLTHYKLNLLGIYPRSFRGILGIIFTPFLHRDVNHLFFNSIPMLVLSCLILVKGRMQFYYVTGFIIFISGFCIWLLGKRSVHIGSSSLVMGYFGYLMASAYYHFSITSVILALLALYYFGGLLYAVFPSSHKEVSWSGHLFGLLAGICTTYFLS